MLMNDYTELKDSELIEKFRSGDKAAWDFLFKRYERLIESQPNFYYAKGADADDIVVAGMEGFYEAVLFYDQNKGAFASFAGLCIGRKIQKFVDKANSRYNSLLHDAVPLPEDEQRAGEEYLLDNTKTNPEAIYLEKERDMELERELKRDLSETEYAVLIHRMDGYSYREIAKNLGISEKAVDNALQRIRKSLRK